MVHTNGADSGISRGSNAANDGAVGTSCTVTVKALVTLWTPSPTAIRTIWTLGPCASEGVHEKTLEITKDPVGPETKRRDSRDSGI